MKKSANDKNMIPIRVDALLALCDNDDDVFNTLNIYNEDTTEHIDNHELIKHPAQIVFVEPLVIDTLTHPQEHHESACHEVHVSSAYDNYEIDRDHRCIKIFAMHHDVIEPLSYAQISTTLVCEYDEATHITAIVSPGHDMLMKHGLVVLPVSTYRNCSIQINLFNNTDVQQTIERGEHLATVMFVKLADVTFS